MKRIKSQVEVEKCNIVKKIICSVIFEKAVALSPSGENSGILLRNVVSSLILHSTQIQIELFQCNGVSALLNGLLAKFLMQPYLNDFKELFDAEKQPKLEVTVVGNTLVAHEINKQLADKERVLAAFENPSIQQIFHRQLRRNQSKIRHTKEQIYQALLETHFEQDVHMQLERPEKPLPEECCNSGCTPCVFDDYSLQLHLYNTTIKNLRDEKVRNQLEDCTVINHEIVGLNAVKLTLTLSSNSSLLKLIRSGSCIHIVASIQVILANETKLYRRAYTPVLINQSSFSIFVKVYQDGLVSKQFLSTTINDTFNIQAKNSRFQFYTYKDYNNLCLICGGIAITIMFQILEQALRLELSSKMNFTLVYASKTDDHIVLLNEINAIRQSFAGSLQVKFFVSKILNKEVAAEKNIVEGRIDSDSLIKALPKPSSVSGKSLAVVAGPPSFNSFVNSVLLYDANFIDDIIVL